MTPVRLWIGLVLVVLGVFGVLDATGTLESTDVIDRCWPIAIIGAGLLLMAVHRRVTLGPAIVVVVGLALLAGQQDWTTEDLLGPALLAVIGLVGATTNRRPKGREISAGRPVAIFGGSTMKDRSPHLEHAEATAVFGGATLDLREARIDDEARVDATAIFGGVDVLVPRGWRVSIGGLPIFGGYEDKTEGNGSLPEGAPGSMCGRRRSSVASTWLTSLSEGSHRWGPGARRGGPVLRRAEQVENRADRRGLAGSVRTEESEDLAGLDLE